MLSAKYSDSYNVELNPFLFFSFRIFERTVLGMMKQD